ncbi:MAG TPA: GNAT family N-acetyltransferase [Thermoplasmata archaeon]|nr:GNAT family N-acetyltransferase [Thermoplasmata archaeon]
MPSPTPATRIEDPSVAQAFLEQIPVTTAVVWNRAFDMEGTKELFIEGDPPRGTLAVARPPWAQGAAGIAMHATEPRAAQELMAAWPHGPVFLHLTAEWMLSLVEPRAETFDGGVFWLFQLDPKDFVDQEGAGVRPLDPKWADRIGPIWDSDWDRAGAYVRARIEAGHAYAVYEDGQPVAWAFLHFETPTVSMMGFLHVLEPYRRKGHARSVASALVKDILRRGKIPALHVKTDNLPSLELTTSLGFHRVKKQVWGDAVIR